MLKAITVDKMKVCGLQVELSAVNRKSSGVCLFGSFSRFWFWCSFCFRQHVMRKELMKYSMNHSKHQTWNISLRIFYCVWSLAPPAAQINPLHLDQNNSIENFIFHIDGNFFPVHQQINQVTSYQTIFTQNLSATIHIPASRYSAHWLLLAQRTFLLARGVLTLSWAEMDSNSSDTLQVAKYVLEKVGRRDLVESLECMSNNTGKPTAQDQLSSSWPDLIW